jgi:steroid 5-alpha reductase family enzyme
LLNATGNAAALTGRPFDAAFALGVVLFLAGLALNLHSDHLLRRLRAPGETGYKVPFGGGFAWVSAPNYLGEIIEWLGFAIAAGTLAAWAFAVFTVANLAPRALSNHRWYRERFPDYPADRRALIPFLW